MPGKRDARERRREAILEILKGNEEIGQQRDLVEKLRKRGIAATQSSVSRDLNELGVIRIGDHYILPDWMGYVSPFQKVLEYIEAVKPAGPYQTLLVTKPGAGTLVAQAIDASAWDDVVGTVAGINSVLVLTDGGFDQKLLYLRLKRYLAPDDEAEAG